jgi:hypothetical protein
MATAPRLNKLPARLGTVSGRLPTMQDGSWRTDRQVHDMNEEEFNNFLQALRDVCKKHGVQITPSMYDGLQVWDLGPNDETLHFPEIENCTNKKET